MRHLIPITRQATSLALAGFIIIGHASARPLDGAPADSATVVAGVVRDPNGRPLASVQVSRAGTPSGTTSGADGRYALTLRRAADVEPATIVARRIGYNARQLRVVLRGDTVRVDIQLVPSQMTLESVVVTSVPLRKHVAVGTGTSANPLPAPPAQVGRNATRPQRESGNTEAYDHIEENAFRSPRVAPLSTFSVDVDRASYANVRRFLSGGALPPKDAVRLEEMVNYFPYDDPTPRAGDAPLRITTEVAPAPWNARHDLVRIALRARDVDMRRAPANNLVFLVDVSGSMQGPGRLPLVKEALALLVNQMREQDRIAIVVYAGSAGLVLPSTSGDQKPRILDAIERLEAGGSTAGGAGIRLAYDVARANLIRGGNNRVILCTDGDFNVGASSDGEMVNLIERRRTGGSYLTILGFGMGNYKDATMEKLSAAGNGNYAYIDDLLEARKMLVKEMGGTLLTVAKDVKLQVEFNPGRVQAYRLLGYEDRLLRDEDFANDAKDAGDIGAGHTVTALYEVVRSDEPLDVPLPGVAPLRYQNGLRQNTRPTGELLHVAMRYKAPDGDRSELVTHPVEARRGDARPSESMRFASAVAGFAMLLRQSPNAGALTWRDVIALARDARGRDEDGFRAEFVRLAEVAAQLRGGIARMR